MSYKNKETTRKEIQDKVKEIKQRQENWLKQRDKSLGASNTKAVKSPAPTSSRTDQLHEPIAKYSPAKYTPTVNENCPKNSSKYNFQSWRLRKEGNSVKKERLGFSSEGHIHSNISRESSALSDHSSLCSTELEDETYNSSLEPDEFDKRADNIIDRVKKELHIKSESVDDKLHNEVLVSKNMQSTKSQVQYFAPSKQGKRPDSHYCPQCRKLMIPPGASAFLVIPCGDTVCESCSTASHKCPVCKMPCTSLAANIMLQQIINDFTGHISHQETKLNRHGTYEETQDFEEEHRNLLLRCEVLESEGDNILEKIKLLEQDKLRELGQVEAIQAEEVKVQQEIAKLHGRLDSLSQHKGDYEKNCADIQGKQNALMKKHNLVKDTICQLQDEAMKVKEKQKCV